MIRFYVFCFIFSFTSCISQSTSSQLQKSSESKKVSFVTEFEKDENYTATYHQTIGFYKELAASFEYITITEFGNTDSGYPLHEVVLINNSSQTKKEDKVVIMINNAIHPGEPCGVDASMMIARDLMTDRKELLEKAIIVIVPIYNISGSLNRGSFSRANQQGPQAYGFRGNAQNLDLNRDFIKCDTENAKSFNALFTKWQPQILIDNHTSNGADYQYVMTLIPTQKDKMEKPSAEYMTQTMLPDLYKKMESKRYKMTPYVYVRSTPDEGIAGFLDYPRYSSGYASLFNCISFMPETHMLKPFADRVKSTYRFTESMLEHVNTNSADIIKQHQKSKEITKAKSDFDLNWTVDMSRIDSVSFDGYTAKYKPSLVSGNDRLYYDHNEPYTKTIAHFNSYRSELSVEKPKAYVIPQAYNKVVSRMKANGVQFEQLLKDEIINVEIYRIENYTSSKTPYEGHYLHRNVAVTKELTSIQYHKGDYVVKTNQAQNKYIVSTLEPQAPDSWFAWNFFDGILMQKEHFSPYVFEDLAEEFLQNNPDVRAELEKRKSEDVDFAKNGYDQLNFVYERSPHYEPTYKRYPVGRIID